LYLRYFEELSAGAIATRTDVPVKTVRTRLGRGLARLRERLAARHGPELRALALLAGRRPGKGATLSNALRPLAWTAFLLVVGGAWLVRGMSTRGVASAVAPVPTSHAATPANVGRPPNAMPPTREEARAAQDTTTGSESARVRIVPLDGNARILEGGRAVQVGTNVVHVAGADGAIVLPLAEGTPLEALVDADGGAAAWLTLDPEVENEAWLEEELAATLQVRWLESGAPVAGASVREIFWDWGESAERFEAFDAMFGAVRATDATGEITVRCEGLESNLFELRVEGLPARLVDLFDQPLGEREYYPVFIDRTSRGLRTHFAAPDGQAIADVPVEANVSGHTFRGTTDADGFLALDVLPYSFEDLGEEEPFTDLFVYLDLGQGRRWRSRRYLERFRSDAPLEFRVEYRPVSGRLISSEPEAFEVATGAIEAENYENPVTLHSGHVIPWQTLDGSGSFTLDAGWQGPATRVLVRHRGTGLVVLEAPATPGVLLELRAPALCRLPVLGVRPGEELRLQPRSETPYRCAGEVPRLAIPDDLTLLVPRGTYTSSTMNGDAFRSIEFVDATHERARVEFSSAASLRRLSGTLSGTLSGAIPHAQLTLRGGDCSANLWTRRDGSWQADVPDVDIEVVAVVENQTFLHRTALPRGTRHVDLVRQEARLVLELDPFDPLVGLDPWHFVFLENRPLVRNVELSGPRTELFLEPGTWKLTHRILRESEPPILVELAAGETRTIVLGNPAHTYLALEFEAPRSVGAELWFELHDLAGKENVWGSQFEELHLRDPFRSGRQHVQAVAPGLYELRLYGRTCNLVPKPSEPMPYESLHSVEVLPEHLNRVKIRLDLD
jgi:hypothetical protein